jgi:hypothetical protein
MCAVGLSKREREGMRRRARRRKRGACTVILTDYITGSGRKRESFKLNKKKTIFLGNDCAEN